MSLIEATLAWLSDPNQWSGANGIPMRTAQHLGYTALATVVGHRVSHTDHCAGCPVYPAVIGRYLFWAGIGRRLCSRCGPCAGHGRNPNHCAGRTTPGHAVNFGWITLRSSSSHRHGNCGGLHRRRWLGPLCHRRISSQRHPARARRSPGCGPSGVSLDVLFAVAQRYSAKLANPAAGPVPKPQPPNASTLTKPIKESHT